MYSANERQQLLNQILTFVKDNHEFECLLQIGSGAEGFTDIYSDIDLMAGCLDSSSVESANRKLSSFFSNMDAIYLDFRKWGNSVLGISAYWVNGLSVDLSFMPTSEIPIRSKCWKMLWAVDDEIVDTLSAKTSQLNDSRMIVNKQLHHSFFFAIRKIEVAIRRSNYIYADMVLGEARQLLLLVEAMIEGKKLHQFKAYHTLSQRFLISLQETYPKELDKEEIIRAKGALLNLYVSIIDENNLCKIDNSQFMIISCFDD